MTQGELNECGGTEFRKADAELNRVYTALMEKLKSDAVATESLKASERAWINFRDAQMKALHPHLNEEGSVHPMCWSLRMAELTAQRTEMLKKLLDSGKEEGDVCNYGS